MQLYNFIIKKAKIFILFLMPTLAMASGSKEESTAFAWAYQNIILIIGILLISIAFIVMYSVLTGMAKYQQKEWLREHGIELSDEKKVASQSVFSKLYEKAWSLVPMDKETDIDLGHNYDGISELDNKLPPWWVYLFYITILWGVLYIYVSHFSDSSVSQSEEYEIAMEEGRVQRVNYLASQPSSVDETNVVTVTDAAALSAGEGIYIRSCVACHGDKGQGGVGPNFADEYWIHGGSIKDLFKIIKYGVPEKGMIAWSSQLQPESMQNVASYILSLKGTNPPNPKEPQGELYKEEGAANVDSSN